MSFTRLPETVKTTPTPFNVAVPESAILELKTLLKFAKVAPPTYESSRPDANYGVTRDWIQKAKAEWETFDWRKIEAHINAFPQYKIPITNTDGASYNIHFLALFSEKPDAVPIMMLHGWPGSFLEFLPILGILSTRYTSATLPYHIIVPSLPGYAFSDPPPLDRNFNLQDVARLLNSLMAQLGFDQYVVQGGDIGSQTARILVAEHANCKAIHMNFCYMTEPPNFDTSSLTASDNDILERRDWFLRSASAYAFEHATRPSTLSFVLSSSPLALLAWIGEKFMDWTDEDPPMTTILESVSLYWFTDTISTSFYPYRNTTPVDKNHIDLSNNPKWHITKPFGYSAFPKEILQSPRRWIETTGKLDFYREHDKGGHFAAIERPETLLKDLEDFVSQVWSGV
ncbi:putative epoxide hydrolase [Mycena venus]|uniref:Putative epoxide hydrolase n=1 Tax=Mycena venus TaxID=2733690 RepID=A0A8H6YVW6_9AGAR|nr:putative epoxide hydrolase [Mycena venus]